MKKKSNFENSKPNNFNFFKNNSELFENENPNSNFSPDLINFLGFVNFKIEKYNKKMKLESFEFIFNKALRNEFLNILINISQNVKKNEFLFHLAKLSVEVNRRLHIKNHFIYKMNKNSIIKRKICFKILRYFNQGIVFDADQITVSEVNTYIGKYIFGQLY